MNNLLHEPSDACASDLIEQAEIMAGDPNAGDAPEVDAQARFIEAGKARAKVGRNFFQHAAIRFCV